MLRHALKLFCCSVPLNSRVGIFPLHLDPPTVQHRELFRLLVGDIGKGCSPPRSGGNTAEIPWYFEGLAGSLQKSRCVPFEHLILVPNTRFPVELRLSAHIAALTSLVTRGLPRVHVDFTALENPDDDMLCVYELTQRYKNSTLVHWLQDAQEMQKWAYFGDVKHRVPLLLLQTVSIPVTAVGKAGDARMLEKISANSEGISNMPGEAAEHSKKECGSVGGEPPRNSDNSANGSKVSSEYPSDGWINEGGGEEEVEISPAYQCYPRALWLANSDDTPLHLEAVDEGDHEINNAKDDCDEGAVTIRANPSSQAEGDPHAVSTRRFFSALSATHDRALCAVQVGRKIHDLVKELCLTPSHSQKPHEGFSTAPMPQPRVEVYSVPRCCGADVRQALWEREVDPSALLTEPVNHYINSHGLYRDYRKDVFPKMTYILHSIPSSDRTENKIRKGRLPNIGFTSVLSFPGIIPRLELHYDKNNSLACDLYEKLSIFSTPEGMEPDLIVPIGGDGYMMHCIRNNWSRFLPFFGVNAGHVGYLLNDPSTVEELLTAPLKLHTTTMLYCLAEREDALSGEKVLLSELAFNDAWVERSSGQTALIRILINGEERIHRLRGDGVLVSTAAGSTAYCRALGASPVPVGAPLIQVVGSNVVSPAQWRPTHLHQEDQVELEVIDSAKRPCRCFVDSVDVGNVTRLQVRSSRAAGVVIAFACSCDLQQKLYEMQFPANM
ncbi:ATP-NAD kinase, putative [Trypanosoma equiperdum]|uniref:ATP-NAD kinase-like protein n=2 Tax=Trypanozoon TaxID=39700 RepID=Q57ZI1_TRYB2|nr:ATP-NAD kinase-like protein [Trypanosoma brucei brucei TREU927]AAX79500.1 ATP-NAD kinase-like protein [Trypanosoma brucei]AAZ12572.1 ATP-NAD kinase-like protein [Trypanosoma brucei brucei TREU927]SCU69869.1 ATP-NAD kinase, putative [Trypanosoma equiperdum]